MQFFLYNIDIETGILAPYRPILTN